MSDLANVVEEMEDEEELSDDEYEDLDTEEELRRLENNDPSLTKARQWISDIGSIDRLGTYIGWNTHLKAMEFRDEDEDEEDIDSISFEEREIERFFLGVVCNRSIKRYHFVDCSGYLGKIFGILAPQFKKNQVERLQFDSCNVGHECLHSLADTLAGFDTLKEFVMKVCQLADGNESHQQLMQSLSGHSGLRKLDLSNTEVGKHGCSALVDLLSNPNINLRVLDLTRNNLGDAEAAALSSGMAENTTLKEINLSSNEDITEVGWQALFHSLSNLRCRLERINLDGNEINDAAAQYLSNALASSTTLKILDLGYNNSITIAGWRGLFGFLRSLNCDLEELHLRDNDFNDEVMTSLTDALATNRSLRNLDLSENRPFPGVTAGTWQIFVSTVLANPSSELEELNIGYCGNINDAAIRVLTNALVNNSKLKVLNLSGNYQITNARWEMFSSVLESPTTALEELDLGGNDIDDATLTSLMNSLANNKKLKKLLYDLSEEWNPPLSVLCNAASIMDTYNSNHILEKLGGGDRYLPDDLVYMLKINREHNASPAARLKIIKTHFNEGFITQPFVDMDLNLLPRAMAWMSRDGRVVEVDGHFYSFIKSISSIFSVDNGPN